eukprot:658164-Pelagomonas_calceolata.AAC.1
MAASLSQPDMDPQCDSWTQKAASRATIALELFDFRQCSLAARPAQLFQPHKMDIDIHEIRYKTLSLISLLLQEMKDLRASLGIVKNADLSKTIPRVATIERKSENRCAKVPRERTRLQEQRNTACFHLGAPLGHTIHIQMYAPLLIPRDRKGCHEQTKVSKEVPPNYDMKLNLFVSGCHQLDSGIHMLSGCQNRIISSMRTECHNVAGRMTIKALSKSPWGSGLVNMDIGS